MAKRIAPLTDLQVSKAKPQDKEVKLFDGGGLFLLVTTNGGKFWRMKYRHGGREKLLALGAYPGTVTRKQGFRTGLDSSSRYQ